MQDMYLGRRAEVEELNNLLGAAEAAQQPATAGNTAERSSPAVFVTAASGAYTVGTM